MISNLKEIDVRSIARILGEAVAFEASHAGRRRFLLDELCRLVKADAWVWAQIRETAGEPPIYANVVHGGFGDAIIAGARNALEQVDLNVFANSVFGALGALGALDLSETRAGRTRESAIPEFGAVNSQHLGSGREPAIGPALLASRPSKGEGRCAIGLYRQAGAKEFSGRERMIADIVLNELPWLHEMGWREDRNESDSCLPLRQRAILSLLLEGLDRKTIANQLGISVNTVSGYCKELYRYYRVNSQVGLMARFYLGNGSEMP